MKEYYVCVTYLTIIEAENEEEAAALTEQYILDGKLVPNDFEIELKGE